MNAVTVYERQSVLNGKEQHNLFAGNTFAEVLEKVEL